jgi:probable HAF family extracellular repeat protein
MTESRTRGQFHFSLRAARVGGLSNLSDCKKVCAVLVLCAATAIASSASAQTYHYHGFLWTATGGLQDLGVPSGWTDSFAFAISQSGRIVGALQDQTTGKETAAKWTPAGGWKPLGKGLSGQYSVALGVNNSEQVVGITNTTGNKEHAFFWTPTGGMQDLGTLAGDTTSIAYGINALGEVVGDSSTPGLTNNAFFWTQSGGMQRLGTLRGPGSYTYANAISDNGVVVGATTGQYLGTVAVLWTAADKIQIVDAIGMSNWASGINRFKQVVGEQDGIAFFWTRAGGVQELPYLPGTVQAFATGINASGEVVGADETETGDQAYIWTSSGGLQALGTLGGPSSAAQAINNAGQVVGYSTVP